jgi:uncharacterized repeat protein (TIGR01451 family)
MKKKLIFCLLFLAHLSVFAQGWIRNFPADSFRLYDAISVKSGGYLAIGLGPNTGPSSVKAFSVIRFDEKGQKLWLKSYSNNIAVSSGLAEFPAMRIMPLSDGDYLAFSRNNVGTSDVLKIDINGVTKWSIRMPLTNFAVKNANNELFMTGKSIEFSTEVLIRMTMGGVQTSQVFTNGRFKDFDVRWDGLIGNQWGQNSILKIKFDGTQVFGKLFPAQGFLQPNFDARFNRFDNGYVILTDSFNLTSVDSLGNVKWQKRAVFQNRSYPLKHITFNAKQEIIGVSFTFGNPSALNILKFDKTGTVISVKSIPLTSAAFNTIESFAPVNGGGYVVTLFASGFPLPSATTTLLKFDEEGNVFSSFINGKVVQDLNNNCVINPTDKPFRNLILNAKKATGDQFWAYTDSLGNYTMNVDTGTYTVQMLPPNNNLWTVCANNVSTKALTTANPRDSANFAMKAKANTPAMTVDISTPFLRRCFNTVYTVNYCNNGTIDADNSYVNVTLDSLFEYLSATKPLTSRTGRVFRFNLGKVAVNECGSFDITARMRCGDSTRLGQSLCTEAKIYPDTIFDDSSLWSGANMTVTGSCLTDSVQFSLRNTGRAATTSLQLLVIQDDALQLRQAVQLPVNGVFTRKYPANGATWRMVVNQEPNNPRSKNPTSVIEGCRKTPNSPFTTGFATQFPNDDGDPTLDIDCQQIRGAFDPNDKQGFPKGYKKEQFIAQNQDIEYLIRFQNTGTDTAFTVIVRDTISDKLDLKSIEFGASSHKYVAELYGKNGVKFTFDNIKLVDSFKNEPKSHGFIKYRIKQNKDLPYGTQITNRAGIYFDFEDPIITNTTIHTIGGKEILSGIFDQPFVPTIAIKVSPNPMLNTALFETPKPISGSLELYDALGQLVRKEKFEGTNFELHKQALPAGIYLYKIVSDNTPFSIGKVIIQ